MPAEGEFRNRFNRNYIWVIPDNLGPGTWRLTADSEEAEPPTPDDFFQATVDSNSPTVLEGQLVYITPSGTAALASSSSIATGRPVGVAANSATPNSLINIAANKVVSITNISVVVEGAPAQFEVGRYYWLSTEPGKFTRDPDTTTSGSVLIQCGLAVSTSEIQIEIQKPLVI